jgi:NADPH2:quinone reductase
MKAIRVHEFGGPEVMRLEEVPDPQFGNAELVVRVRAVGVNPVDTYIRTGTHARRPSLPYTPGLDGSGEVLSVGSGVTAFRPGDRVYLSGAISGTYAEQALCEESQVHRLPQNVSFQQGAAMGVPYTTAYRAMFQTGQVQPGETVLVHGASGGMGLAAVQLGSARGITMIGTAGTENGMALVREQGARHVLNHNDPGYLDELLSLTGGRGVNAIMEMLANKNLGKDLTVLAPKGRVVVIGSRGPVEITPRDAMGRDASIHGIMLFNASAEDLRSIHSALVAGLENGTLRPVIGQELPLAEAVRAHDEVLKTSGAHGKIVLLP